MAELPSSSDQQVTLNHNDLEGRLPLLPKKLPVELWVSDVLGRSVNYS
jgi:hypothetical protein